VFCQDSGFRDLISNGIGPLLTNFEESAAISAFTIALNSQQGANLRISLLVDDRMKEAVLDEFHESISNYLLLHPSVDIQTVYPINGFLMPFENNSIQYNLFDASLEGSNLLLGVENAFSTVILKFFSENDMGTESLFYLLFLTIACALKAISNHSAQRHTDPADLIAKAFGITTTLSPESRQFLKENEKFIISEFTAIMAASNHGGNYEFLKNLENEAGRLAGAENSSGYAPTALLASMGVAFSKQLGVTEKSLYFVAEIIYTCLRSFNPNFARI
jgi:hypothetical protein